MPSKNGKDFSLVVATTLVARSDEGMDGEVTNASSRFVAVCNAGCNDLAISKNAAATPIRIL
jgi:hypothetical protein